MSLHFFRKTLDDVRQLIKKGDQKSLKRADQILFNHLHLIGNDLSDEQAAFVALATASHEHIKILKKLYDDIAIKASQSTVLYPNLPSNKELLRWVDAAEKQARSVILFAEKVTKLCKKEELDVR